MPADILPQCPVIRVMTITSSGEVAQAVRRALDPGQFHCRTGQWRHADACGGRAWCPHLAVMDMECAGAALQHPRPHGRLPEQHLPVLVLVSQPGDPRARLAPFAWGADDVLSLPFVPEELAARIRAIVRRTYFVPARPVMPLRMGELEIDMLNHRVLIGDRRVHLSALDLSLLYLLAANADRVMTRNEILDHLWGAGFVPESNVVDRHVRSLRACLDDDWRQPHYIATVPGRGYRYLLPRPGPQMTNSS